LRKTPFFRRKLAKIAENCDHNIDPRMIASDFFIVEQHSNMSLAIFILSKRRQVSIKLECNVERNPRHEGDGRPTVDVLMTNGMQRIEKHQHIQICTREAEITDDIPMYLVFPNFEKEESRLNLNT
jgi:hypothetical protein